MGEKDFQQLFLVKKHLEGKYKTKIIPCKTIRDKNKIALSSRNFLLGKFDLRVAANIYKKLVLIKKKYKKYKKYNKLFKS